MSPSLGVGRDMGAPWSQTGGPAGCLQLRHCPLRLFHECEQGAFGEAEEENLPQDET